MPFLSTLVAAFAGSQSIWYRVAAIVGPPPTRDRSSSTCVPGLRGTLTDTQPGDRGLVDLDAETGLGRQRNEAIADRERRPHHILREVEMREADAPVDIIDRAS